VPRALALARKLGWPFEHHVDIVLPSRAVRSRPATHFRHAALAGPFCFIGLGKNPRAMPPIFFHIPTGRRGRGWKPKSRSELSAFGWERLEISPDTEIQYCM